LIIPIREWIRQGRANPIRQTMNLTEELSGHPSITDSGPVQVDLTTAVIGEELHIEGHATLDVNCDCSRCLVLYKETVEIPIQEVFSLKKPEIDVEDEDIHYIGEDTVDLAPYILDNVWLGLPFIPLHDEDCKGLCPVCGTDRNMQSCDCEIV